MMSWATLSVFVPTFLFVSLTPGMCMTLAMVLGMTQGVKRTLWMMVGELLGVGLVAAAAGAGVAALMLRQPELFVLFKWVGGAYLGYLGIMMWRSRGRMAIPSELDAGPPASPLQLAMQGFVTAVANPKGWAFFMVLLPPFLDSSRPLPGQLSLLIAVILTIEFVSMLVYATGGKTLRNVLGKSGNVRLLNRIAGTLMIGVGLWLALG
ncbi:LysE family translocator [Halomonas profundus]|jgi:threonine/homoserine/homoserine lactone efflux protein|uniref:Lysine-type exporter protein (LYSE/YGGA) n=2 Tax=Vreelandella titanicae TaxID=664683 RepID=L9UA08_9GAMM|nr:MULTISPECIES: LysE family translocator [Halomonas]UEQ02220.1 LysE family translocator [Halomonas profundus]ELY21765.1 Lysine-type exporter protein (LYSE/YGGA) [Halomonas titanicae BH1]MCE7519115.1 LysE family translocator [Halomonas titanicae]NVE91227.1 LysE family translocator [Halomonas titanicae]QKS23859.1 Homoserine/homoserine lactone efflux protein [Halomonas titanicae]|tara:strand:- start:4912 stop:5535 length:624 start_codon:yes stop_codon:yes gene_type:complete